jgi:hypothetical protein
MRLPILLISAVLAGGLLQAQDKPAETPKPSEVGFEAAIIPIKTLNGDSFNRLVRLLSVFNAKLSGDEKLRTILVYAPKDVIAQVRRVVEDLDKPGSEAAIGRNIEMTLAFLRCSTKASADTPALPADLESVGRQLRAATQYKDIQLFDVMPVRLQEGMMTDASTRLPGFPNTTMRFRPEAVIRKDQGRYVRFDTINIDLRNQSGTASLHTAGDFMEGQKTVLGKVSGADDDTATFVVISLKVLD